MLRKVFFSFDYKDVSDFRANVVRNSRALKKAGNPTSFIDKSLWEEAKKKDPESLKLLISNGLNGCGVTVVLVGKDTASRRWVKYEIVKSFIEGKAIIVVHINRIRSRSTKKITAKGINPLSRLKLVIDDNCKKIYFFELKNKKWVSFQDLPFINNRQKNSFFFREGAFFRKSHCGKSFLFSDLFEMEYCWIKDDGYNCLPSWISDAAIKVGR